MERAKFSELSAADFKATDINKNTTATQSEGEVWLTSERIPVKREYTAADLAGNTLITRRVSPRSCVGLTARCT